MKKKTVTILGILILLFCFPLSAQAQDQGLDGWEQEYYEDQMEQSGANDLPEELPNDARNIMERMGVNGTDWESLSALTPQAIFGQVADSAKTQSSEPLQAVAKILSVMLLCALMEGLKFSVGDRPLSGVVSMVSTLCICMVIIMPVVSCIEEASSVINGAAGFLLCYVPVMAGIMIAGGQGISAASYQVLMMGAGQVIAQIASHILVPLLSIFLAMSITSAVSPRLNLNGICAAVSKIVKWVLGLSMTVFVSLLTLQSLLGTAADSTGGKAAKFLLSSFVPVVGGALGDALSTVQSCVRLLKSGVGAFGIVAAGCIFLPILLKCLFWQAAVHLCACVGDVFSLGHLSSLLRAAGSVVGIMLPIILCCMLILTVSTVIILMVGGGAA